MNFKSNRTFLHGAESTSESTTSSSSAQFDQDDRYYQMTHAGTMMEQTPLLSEEEDVRLKLPQVGPSNADDEQEEKDPVSRKCVCLESLTFVE